jgi:hypothetical protein
MPSTYSQIATTTLGSAAASITLSSIPQIYTNLVLVVNGSSPNDSNGQIQFNGDTGSNYSMTVLNGNGSSATSARTTNATNFLVFTDGTGTAAPGMGVTHIMGYSNTTTFKTSLSRHGGSTTAVRAVVGLWRNTAAINQILMYTDNANFNTGTTFTLYGIKGA